MISFDFITDEEFRNSLESDYSELISCLSSKAYKSVHVLAGSITEAVLIDYLISETIILREKALKLDFGEAIKTCLDNGIISTKTGDLCSVIKSYRNLIHPGRIVRLNESVSMESAEVAKALVSIVVGEVDKKKRENYGYTAEQIVSKIENDPGARSIIPNLLSQANPVELKRIMLSILPKQYLALPEFIESPHILPAYEECFHTAFNLSSEDVKKKVAGHLAKVVKEESGENLVAYGTLFLKTDYLQYMTSHDLKLVKKYQLSKLKDGVDTETLLVLKGIGKYLDEDKDEISTFVDPLVKTICRLDNPQLEEKAKKFFFYELQMTKSDVDILVSKRLGNWIKFYSEKEQNVTVQKIQELKEYVDLLPPF